MKSDGVREVLRNEWLGGRDLNPDTQSQSLYEASDSKADQQVRSNRGRVQQDPQSPRKKGVQLKMRVRFTQPSAVHSSNLPNLKLRRFDLIGLSVSEATILHLNHWSEF